MTQILQNDANKETKDAIYFYTPPYYALDNFSAYEVELWGKTFPTGEHAYQWKKFIDAYPDIAEEIYQANSPSTVKKISDAHKEKIPQAFHEQKVALMEEILRVKFHQHEKVRRILRESGTKTIIENSPIDYFWGIGADGTGENILGKLWMKIRDSETFESN